MQLHVLLFGKSKKKMRPIMIDKLKACEQYRDAREASKGTKAAAGWHKIEVAPKDSVLWKQKTATVGGNKDNSAPRRIGEKLNGWIGKSGFNQHT